MKNRLENVKKIIEPLKKLEVFKKTRVILLLMVDGPDTTKIHLIHVRPPRKNEPHGSKEPNIKILFFFSKKQSIVVAKPRVEIVVKPYKLPLIRT